MDTKINHNFSLTKGIATLLLLALAACGGGGSGNGSPGSGGVISTINFNATTSISEGQTGTTNVVFSLTLDSANTADISVEYQTFDITAGAGDDYLEASGTLLIPAGDTSVNVIVSVNSDQCFEENETFALTLSNVSSNAKLDNREATVTIINDDDMSVLSIADASMTEGNAGQSHLIIDVNLDKASCYITTADYATSNVTANEPDDYVQTNGTLTIPAGETQATITVPVNGDINFENNETLTINLANLSEFVALGDDSAFGTLINDDTPVLFISNSTIAEGPAGETENLIFTLTLEGATDEVSLDYTTVDGGATTVDNDYMTASGTLVIPAGNTSAQIAVVVNGDDTEEPTEAFQLQLSNLSGSARLDTFLVTGSIINDDNVSATPERGLSISHGKINEGAAGETSELTFSVSIDSPLTETVIINYETENITAESGSDYVGKNSNVVILAGETEAQISIAVNGDDAQEDDESFRLNIKSVSSGVSLLTPFVTGLIVDDDGSSVLPRMNVDNAGIYEAENGEITLLVFTISLTAAAATSVTVDYAMVDDTAIANSDYITENGTLTFPAGSTEQQLLVTVIGDDFIEADERFKLLLSNLDGDAVLNHDTGIGHILTDDPFAAISINDVAALEGDTGNSELTFTVSLSAIAADDVSVDFETQNVTALDTEDYIYASGRLVIPAGEINATLNITINGDTDIENDEEFLVLLSNLSANAETSDTQGKGVIVNDDAIVGWQVPQTAGQGKDPQISTDSGGNTAAIWVSKGDLFDSLDDIQTSLFSGGVWQASEKIADTPNAADIDKAILSIGSIGNGETIAVWRDSPEFGSKIYQNGSWIDVLVTSSSGLGRWFTRMAASESGLAFSVWEEVSGSSGKSWLSEYNNVGSGWGMPLELQPDASDPDFAEAIQADDPLIDLNPSGNGMVIWRQSFTDVTLNRIYYRYYDAASSSWNNASFVVDTDWATVPHQLLMYDNGDAVMVGVDKRGAGLVLVWFYDRANDQWTISSDAGSSNVSASPQAAIDGNNNLFVTWSTQDTFDIYVNHFDDQTASWEATPTLLSVADGYSDIYPQIAADASGNAIVVWSQDINNGSSGNPAQYRIRASRFSASSSQWSPATQVDDDSVIDRQSFDPAISMDVTGNAYIIWEYRTEIDQGGYFTTEYEIGRARYIAP